MSSAIPKQVYTIGGLVVNVYEEPLVHSSSIDPVVLFFLHGRLGSAEGLERAVRPVLQGLKAEREANAALRPVIIVTFVSGLNRTVDMGVGSDQRNHGTRLVDPKANEAWNPQDVEKHNERHAIDMYSIQTGTAKDITFLIDFLPAYLFPHGERTIADWVMAGISLGGHATWIALKSDKRISTGIPIIGCPDYLALVSGRANLTSTPFKPPYVPESLVRVVHEHDPAWTSYTSADVSNPFLGKKILVLSGAEDKLVPWSASQEFVEKLQVGEQGKKEIFLEEGAGHECTKAMLERMVKFLSKYTLSASA